MQRESRSADGQSVRPESTLCDYWPMSAENHATGAAQVEHVSCRICRHRKVSASSFPDRYGVNISL